MAFLRVVSDFAQRRMWLAAARGYHADGVAGGVGWDASSWLLRRLSEASHEQHRLLSLLEAVLAGALWPPRRRRAGAGCRRCQQAALPDAVIADTASFAARSK